MLLVLYSSTMSRKTRANRVPSTPSVSPSRVQLFRNERCREAYEKLNSKCKIWVERFVILDEVDPAVKANLESRGWLSLLVVEALGVPVVTDPVYPYDELPPIDEVISHITGSSI